MTKSWIDRFQSNSKINLATLEILRTDWRPRGVLMAHLHEHERGAIKLIRLPDKPMFASASGDGTIKVGSRVTPFSDSLNLATLVSRNKILIW